MFSPGDSARGPWTPEEWWNGYHLTVPGVGDQELLPCAAANTLMPSMPGRTFPIVTKQRWQVGCLAQTNSGEPGEAFLAVAPDGTQYWFVYLVYHAATTITKPLGSGPGPFATPGAGTPIQPNASSIDFVSRRKARMLVSRIQDRFGN